MKSWRFCIWSFRKSECGWDCRESESPSPLRPLQRGGTEYPRRLDNNFIKYNWFIQKIYWITHQRAHRTGWCRRGGRGTRWRAGRPPPGPGAGRTTDPTSQNSKVKLLCKIITDSYLPLGPPCSRTRSAPSVWESAGTRVTRSEPSVNFGP